MANKDSNGNWINPRGHVQHPSTVDAVDKKRDQVVERIWKKFNAQMNRMAKLKAEAYEDMDTYLDYSAEKSGVKPGGAKGSVTIQNFSGTKKIEIRVHEYVDFDERIHQAKALIDECIAEWAEQVNNPIKEIVQEVFDTEQKGKLNVKGLRSLKRLKINHKKWQQAMGLLTQAELIAGSKRYIRAYSRAGIEGDWESIPMDFAAIKPDTHPEEK